MKTELPAALTHVFERQAHPYYMWEGMASIPAGMEDILAQPVREAILAASGGIRSKSTVHLMGCGSSYFAAGAIALAIQQIAGMPAYAWEAHELLAYPPVDLAASAVIGISHTGGTPPVVRAVEMARSLGACTVAYSDGIPSALTRAAEWVVPSRLGIEPALPKTRSYIGALMRGFLQTVELARLGGKETHAWEAALSLAPELARGVLESGAGQVNDLAERWQGCRRMVVSGGGPQHATAQEGMLKLTEAAMVSSVSWEIEEAVHGTWASTVENDLMILLAMDGPGYENVVRLAGGMKTIGARVWVLTDRAWEGVEVDALTHLPEGQPELFMPLYAILPIYQLSYYLALCKGLSPDNMRMDDPRFLDARMQMRSSLS